MKRIGFLLVFSIVFIWMMVSIATADVLFTTNRFEFSLPDSWHYEKSSLLSVHCRSTSGYAFLFYESDLTFPDTIDEIADFTINTLGIKDYATDFEEVEIAGQKTALVELREETRYGLCAMIKKGNKTIIAFFSSLPDADYKGFFIRALNSVNVRPDKDVGFFNYGNAEAKLVKYSTKTVGKKKYLILDFTWRNVGDIATMFAVNVGVTVYQDGIQLNEGYLFTEDTEVGTSIMPGKELAVKEIFELRSSSGTLDIVVDKLMDFTNEIIDRNYTFILE